MTVDRSPEPGQPTFAFRGLRFIARAEPSGSAALTLQEPAAPPVGAL